MEIRWLSRRVSHRLEEGGLLGVEEAILSDFVQEDSEWAPLSQVKKGNPFNLLMKLRRRGGTKKQRYSGVRFLMRRLNLQAMLLHKPKES